MKLFEHKYKEEDPSSNITFTYDSVITILDNNPGIEVTFKNGMKTYFFFNHGSYYIVGPTEYRINDFSRRGMEVISKTWDCPHLSYGDASNSAISDFCNKVNAYHKEGKELSPKSESSAVALDNVVMNFVDAVRSSKPIVAEAYLALAQLGTKYKNEDVKIQISKRGGYKILSLVIKDDEEEN